MSALFCDLRLWEAVRFTMFGRLICVFGGLSPSIRMGKKQERSVSERRRREARRRRLRGSIADGTRSFNAARGSGERCKPPPPAGPAEPGRQTTFGAFFVLRCNAVRGSGGALKAPQFQCS